MSAEIICLADRRKPRYPLADLWLANLALFGFGFSFFAWAPVGNVEPFAKSPYVAPAKDPA